MKLAKLNNKPEIFYTIQGEGKSIGTPAVFVRLSLCNLHCTWCDTPYTWNWNGTRFEHLDNTKYDKEQNIIEISNQELLELVTSFNCKLIVFTGGEPLLQEKKLIEVFEALKKLGHNIEVETNGTIVPSFRMTELVDNFNVSPKLSNSGNSEKIRDRASAMLKFSRELKCTFKFVIQNKQDLVEVKNLISKYNIDPEIIYLMPEGRTDEEIKLKSEWLIDICKANGYKFSTRLHVLIWGAKQGV